jgi:hypothetical protein
VLRCQVNYRSNRANQYLRRTGIARKNGSIKLSNYVREAGAAAAAIADTVTSARSRDLKRPVELGNCSYYELARPKRDNGVLFPSILPNLALVDNVVSVVLVFMTTLSKNSVIKI